MSRNEKQQRQRSEVFIGQSALALSAGQSQKHKPLKFFLAKTQNDASVFLIGFVLSASHQRLTHLPH
jgi:hypothetical protein